MFEIQRCTEPVADDPGCLLKEKLDTKKTNTTLYKVVCNYYVGLNIQMLKEKSYGILNIIPKDKNGTPIYDLKDAIVRKPGGTSFASQ